MLRLTTGQTGWSGTFSTDHRPEQRLQPCLVTRRSRITARTRNRCGSSCRETRTDAAKTGDRLQIAQQNTNLLATLTPPIWCLSPIFTTSALGSEAKRRSVSRKWLGSVVGCFRSLLLLTHSHLLASKAIYVRFSSN